MYIRWLGEYGQFYGMKSFDFEFQRKSEASVEYIDQHTKYIQCADLGVCAMYNVSFGLLCNPKGVVRTFRYDAWSMLRENGTLTRGKDGNFHRGYHNHPRKDYREAWVKPGYFTGIVVHLTYSNPVKSTAYDQGICNLPASTKKMLKKVSDKYNIPILQWKKGTKDVYKLKEIKL